MNIIETQFKQRAYDGKWQLWAKYMDHDNSYSYETESGQRMTLTPTAWMVVGVYDYLIDMED